MDREGIILYEDAELIVCHKPAGIAVQSARVGQKDMVSILNNHLADRQPGRRGAFAENRGKQAAQREIPAVYVVHRLDQPVEGVLVFAKTKRAAAELSRQVADGSMEKIYWAVCCATKEPFETERQPGRSVGKLSENDAQKRVFGFPEIGKTYQLVNYLVKDGRTNTSSIAKDGDRAAKRAELFFRVREKLSLGRTEGADGCLKGKNSCADGGLTYCLAEIELKTGRHHQIRAQMAHAGLPLYGDRKYNERWEDFLLPPARQDGVSPGKTGTGLALCAVSLAFSHPATGKPMTFQTEPTGEAFQLFSGRESGGERAAAGE